MGRRVVLPLFLTALFFIASCGAAEVAEPGRGWREAFAAELEAAREDEEAQTLDALLMARLGEQAGAAETYEAVLSISESYSKPVQGVPDIDTLLYVRDFTAKLLASRSDRTIRISVSETMLGYECRRSKDETPGPVHSAYEYISEPEVRYESPEADYYIEIHGSGVDIYRPNGESYGVTRCAGAEIAEAFEALFFPRDAAPLAGDILYFTTMQAAWDENPAWIAEYKLADAAPLYRPFRLLTGAGDPGPSETLLSIDADISASGTVEGIKRIAFPSADPLLPYLCPALTGNTYPTTYENAPLSESAGIRLTGFTTTDEKITLPQVN